MRSGKRLSRGIRKQHTSGERHAGTEWAGEDAPPNVGTASGAAGGELSGAGTAGTGLGARDDVGDGIDGADVDGTDDSHYAIFRVRCPDCARPIALLADEEELPEHALCPTPWNPFGLTVCSGSGRAVKEAPPAEGEPFGEDQGVTALLTLPEGLHWRMQPFSHVGGAGACPIRPADAVRVPRMRG